MRAVDDVALLPLEGDGVDLQHPDDLVHDALCLHGGGGLHAPCEVEGTRLLILQCKKELHTLLKPFQVNTIFRRETEIACILF